MMIRIFAPNLPID